MSKDSGIDKLLGALALITIAYFFHASDVDKYKQQIELLNQQTIALQQQIQLLQAQSTGFKDGVAYTR